MGTEPHTTSYPLPIRRLTPAMLASDADYAVWLKAVQIALHQNFDPRGLTAKEGDKAMKSDKPEGLGVVWASVSEELRGLLVECGSYKGALVAVHRARQAGVGLGVGQASGSGMKR